MNRFTALSDPNSASSECQGVRLSGRASAEEINAHCTDSLRAVLKRAAVAIRAGAIAFLVAAALPVAAQTSFPPPITSVPITALPDPAWTVAGIGDFDGDGHSDILWRNTLTGENSIWLMNGSSVSSSSFIQSVPDRNWAVVKIGDFDGDGKADIVWRNTRSGQNCIWLMNGVTIASSAFLPTLADPNWTIAGVGGFNGTLNATTGRVKTDILWRNTANGQNAIWFMDGTTVSSTAFMTSVSTAWTIAGVGDYNGDGKADILWRNKSNGQNAIWLMNGATTSSGVFMATVADLNWTIVGTGDYNGDGQTDILWRNKSNGQNSIWLMNGVSISSSVFMATVSDLNWTVAGTGDYNGDGNADILWRNTATGENSLWLTTPGADTTPPSVPAGLTGTAVSSTQINLSWNASTDNVAVTGYRVYRGGTLIATLGNVTTYQNTGLSPATTYVYTVQAVDGAGNASAQSAAASTTTQAVADTTPPSVPAGLTGTAVSSTQINLSWNASTDNVAVTGYRVYRGGTLIATLGNVTTYQNTGLTASTAYAYTVQAVDGAGNASAQSALASTTTRAR